MKKKLIFQSLQARRVCHFIDLMQWRVSKYGLSFQAQHLFSSSPLTPPLGAFNPSFGNRTLRPRHRRSLPVRLLSNRDQPSRLAANPSSRFLRQGLGVQGMGTLALLAE